MKKRIRPGSVIVLHDKPSSAVFSVLGEFVSYAKSEGYEFVTISFSGKE
jgi:peptidoglycan/xylan/chitin deacetylase (PgdA/CDA1 family)